MFSFDLAQQRDLDKIPPTLVARGDSVSAFFATIRSKFNLHATKVSGVYNVIKEVALGKN